MLLNRRWNEQAARRGSAGWAAPALVILLAVLAGCRHPEPASPAAAGQTRQSLQSFLPSPQTGGFVRVEEVPGRISTHYTFTNASVTLKVEAFRDLDPDAADLLLNEGIMGLQALYANALSPYPGDISNKVVAGERFRPQYFRKQEQGVTYTYFLLYANDRFGYGATAPDLLKYRSLLGWVYCRESRNFYKVRCFAPLAWTAESLERTVFALGCP